jgi:hypothetical protein
MGCGR